MREILKNRISDNLLGQKSRNTIHPNENIVRFLYRNQTIKNSIAIDTYKTTTLMENPKLEKTDLKIRMCQNLLG